MLRDGMNNITAAQSDPSSLTALTAVVKLPFYQRTPGVLIEPDDHPDCSTGQLRCLDGGSLSADNQFSESSVGIIVLQGRRTDIYG